MSGKLLRRSRASLSMIFAPQPWWLWSQYSITMAELAANTTRARSRCTRCWMALREVRRGKPDPEGFLLAAERLGVRIDQCLVFEDSPAGVAAARASGAHVAIVGGHVPVSEGDFALQNYP
jgi:beta-phosphoglucomutase-like phosphatase (HAD superfamily)